MPSKFHFLMSNDIRIKQQMNYEPCPDLTASLVPARGQAATTRDKDAEALPHSFEFILL